MRPSLLILIGCTGGPATSDEPVPTPDCPTFAPGEMRGRVSTPPAREVSGLAVGDDVLWVHNDSGEPAELHAIQPEGGLLATVTLQGVDAIDFEDMARAPGPDGRMWLWVGDIGDNAARRNTVQVYRFPEPEIANATVVAERLDYSYPDGPRDAETLMVDPVDGTLWILSKELDGSTGFYRDQLPRPGPIVLEKALTKTFGEPPLGQATLVTGGDLDARGLVVRTYLTDAFVWARGAQEPVIQALERDPCPVQLVGEPQPEAIGWGPTGLWTISEGDGPAVNFHALE